MKTKNNFFTALTFLIIGLFLYNCSTSKITEVDESRKPLLLYAKGKVYQPEWRVVDSLEQNGLSKSALIEVVKIQEKAIAENNYEQIVKALIVKAKFQSYVQEDAFVATINEIKLEAEKADYPLKPFLHSIVADLYWKYYTVNSWKISNRTATVDFENDNIDTWDLTRITQETIKHYQLSVLNIDSLKRTPIETFNEIIIEKNARKYRPFLYDFLAHRAADFFMNEQPSIIKPIEEFNMSKLNYFSGYQEFAKINITTKDSLSLKWFGLKLLQNLTLNHLNDTNPIALIDVELKRLKFVKNNSNINGKDSIYSKRLNDLYTVFAKFASSTEIIYEIANTHYTKGITYDATKSDANKEELKKAHSLCLNAINKFPKSFGASQCKVLANVITQKSLSVEVEKVNIPNAPIKAKVTFKNLEKVYFKLIQIDFDKYNKWGNLSVEKRMDKLLEKEALKTWDLDLQNDGDFNAHAGEFSMDAQNMGFYVLLTATNPEFSIKNEAVALTPFWVSNISYLTRKLKNEVSEFIVVDRVNGTPLKGVKAKLFYSKYSYTTRRYERKSLGVKITDKNGSIKVLPGSDYRSFQVDFSLADDRLSTQDAFYQYRNYDEGNRKFIKTVFFTDRAIYRPGQTIYFKGIVLASDNENNNKIKTNYGAVVTFYDVNNQKIKELKLTTNEYGTYSGSFIIPNNGMNGQMHIETQGTTKYISVEEYKRPKFEVKFEPIKGSYKLGETVTVKGNAKTYAGAALDEATVNYRIVRNASFPYWCYYRWGNWGNSAQKEIKNGTTKTDDNGVYTIGFIAKADAAVDKKFSPTYSYTIYADVVDINGETHSSTTFVSVGYNALKIATTIPEKVNKNGVDTLDFTTTNLNGEFEAAEGNVKIWSLQMPKQSYRSSLWEKGDKKYMTKEEYTKKFPLDEYEHENNQYKWGKKTKVYDRNFNTANRKAIELYQLPEWESGVYVLEAICKDKFGQEVKELKYFTVFNALDKKVPTNAIEWFTPLKTHGEPGENAEFLIGSAAKNVNILYEIEHKGEIIQQERLVLKNGEQRKIVIPILEKYRGNFQVHFLFVKHGRSYSYSVPVTVPHTNKLLDVEFSTFRNKLLPGQKEEWKIKILGKNGEKVAAEMVAALYDASLDAFKPNYWGLNVLYYDYSKTYWQNNTSFSSVYSQLSQDKWNKYISRTPKSYDQLNWFGFNYGRRYYDYYSEYGDDVYEMESVVEEKSKRKFKPVSSPSFAENMPSKKNKDGQVATSIVKVLPGVAGNANQQTRNSSDFTTVKARKNFSETAFFYPHLTTDKNGEITINFTIPEALTKWKFMALAHTKDLKTGMLYGETVTQKDLMVFPNAPRFFREHDKMTFSTKITNLSAKDLEGNAKIFFYDALTMKLISTELLAENDTQSFVIKKGKSTAVNWKIEIPAGYSAITYKIVAKAGNFSDGEEMVIPVLTDRILVTESMPLPIRGKGTYSFNFTKLAESKFATNPSPSGRLGGVHHKLTLEFTSNPAWYAIQALPYLMEYPYECAEQTFSRFYANSIAAHIANSNPKIKAVFNSWKSKSSQAFLSNLEKNQELKAVLLEETPWVLNAQNESERKKRVGLLFDLNRMSNELGRAEKKLQQLQVSNGGWTWFKGMPENRYMTQHIVTGMGHLDHLGVKKIRNDATTWNMVQKAIRYLDNRIREDYEWLKKHQVALEKDHLSNSQIQYLYARSYFRDVKIDARNREAYNYYNQQAEKYWLTKSSYMQGMIALALNRQESDKTIVPQKIIASLKENAINHEELGMYWKDKSGGYYWYQAPIETQALLIEAFDEVADDKESVEAMKIWLLKQKQTQDWKTTRATTEACYALLLRGTDLLASNQLVEINVGGKLLDLKKMDDVKVEAGTGYFKTSWSKTEIKPEMGNVTVTKKDDGVAWGAMYWQYFEQLDKITPAETPLKLVKKLFLQKNTPSGPVITPIVAGKKLQLGDKIIVRIELRVDRNMEYVHLKDMRAAGLEPIHVFSGYRYQDGLGYYESTKDAATNFFFDYLKKGTYVFEYPLRVNMVGDFSNGITSIQCMYAPEFTAHSEGIRLKIEE